MANPACGLMKLTNGVDKESQRLRGCIEALEARPLPWASGSELSSDGLSALEIIPSAEESSYIPTATLESLSSLEDILSRGENTVDAFVTADTGALSYDAAFMDLYPG